MIFSQRHRERWFDDWLDRRVNPSIPVPDMDNPDDDVLQPVIDAAHRFHTLTTTNISDDTAERQHIWEQIMQQQPATASHPALFGTATTADPAGLPARSGEPRVSRLTWTGIISATLAAVLLIALIAGYRGFDGRFGAGTDRGDAPMQLAASGDDSTPEATPGSATGDPFTIYAPVENPYPESDEAVYRVDQHQCSTAPISRDDLTASLALSYNPNRYAAPYSDSITVSDSVKQELAAVANEFMACFVQGKPMSALALTTDTFRQQFVFNQLLYAPGGISDNTITAFVDQLVDQQQAAEANPEAYAARQDTYLPTFDGDQGLQTIEDGRIYAVFNWLVRTDPARNETQWADRHPLFAQPPYQMVFIANMDVPPGSKWIIDAVGWQTIPSQG